VVAEFRDPIYPGLVSTGKVERGGDKPFHTVINAENFHALQALLFTHRGQGRRIYIDPPYNTGAKDWKYNNDYVESDDLYRHSASGWRSWSGVAARWRGAAESRRLGAHRHDRREGVSAAGFPKSLYAVEDALRVVRSDKPDAIVLDFFSGSGTTAHAVMRLNRQDGGRRQCISVTNNEVSADEETAACAPKGLRPGDPEWEALGICEHITKPRIARRGHREDAGRRADQGDYKFTDEFPMAEGSRRTSSSSP
jgi:CheY-like chemotaxis protein